MNLEKFNLLSKHFENKRFESTQKSTALILFWGSYLGNLLSIILSYFFIIKLLQNTAVHFTGENVILPVFVILFLTILELAKRFTLANVTIAYLTVNKKTTSFIGGVIFVFILVGSTFYLSLSGASTYTNKSDIITTTMDNTVNNQVDSLKRQFNEVNNKLEQRITYLYTAAGERKNKSLKSVEIQQVKDWENSIKENNKILESKTTEIKTSNISKADLEKDKSNKSQWAFILISAFIEILILCGVIFNRFYQYTSYKEQKEILDSNENYKKLITYEVLLRVLYNNGKINANSNLPTASGFKDLVAASTKRLPQKSITEFLMLMNALKISQIIGKSRITVVNYEKAQEILSNYLTIETE